MTKYAFIINLPGQTPETFSSEFQVEGSYNIVVGTDNFDSAREYIRVKVEEGFSMFNLCPDFNDETTEELQQIVGDKAKIRNTRFLPDEEGKADELENVDAIGLIIVEDVDESKTMSIDADGFTAIIAYVGNQEQANETARCLVSRGVEEIAMCSWFDEARTRSVIAAIDGVIPVGSCGL